MTTSRFPHFFICILAVASLLPLVSLQGQGLADESDADLFHKLQKGFTGDLVALRPVIQEVMKRTAEDPARQESLTFLMALSYQDEYSKNKSEATLQNAIKEYETYLKKFPAGVRRDFVRFNLGGAYDDLKQYDKALPHFQWLFRRSEISSLRNAARDKMCRIYIKSNTAGEGIPLFQEVFKASLLDPDLRAQAATWLIQGYLAKGQPKETTPYLRYLTGRYEAIYDPKFNITLLKTGDAMFEREDYDQAILLYTFVKSRDSIIEFYRDLVSKMQNKIRYISPEADNYAVVDGQLKSAQANLKAVREIRSYDVDMQWRIARVFKETERNWEALWAFYHLYQDYPDHEQVEDFLYIAFKQADLVFDVTMLEMLADEYLGNELYTKYEDEVTLALAAFYSKQERYEELVALCKDYLENPKSLLVAAQLVNYLGNYYVKVSLFEELNREVSPLMRRFKGQEPLYETARYWTGLSEILLADYGKAAETMKSFIQDYDESSSYYEDVFYRYGICLYGLQQNQEAEDQFTKFVKKYPKSVLRGEAELYLGDLKRERRAYAESADHYRNVEPNTENPAFIAKASFALAEVLEVDDKEDEAVEVLKSYIERHGETGQLADAYYRLGMIYDRLGMYDVRFGFHAKAIKLLGDDAWRYAVDQLTSSYVEDYVRYEKTFNVSTALLNRLLSEPEFRKQFLSDRAYQYQFMQSDQGVFLERSLANKLVRDREFRAKIIETEIQIDPVTGAGIPPKGPVITAEMAIEQLRELHDFYTEKSDKLAPHTPRALFPELLAAAKANDQYALEMRSEMALDSLKDEDERGQILYTYEELTSAPPAVINWAAAKREASNPDEAIKLYTFAMKRHPYAPSAYDSVLAMADLTLRQAEASTEQEDWETALSYYNLVTSRYAMKIKDAEPHLKKGHILSELGRDKDAIDVLGMILRNPAWKGLNHAEAHLELGMAYRRQGQLAEAHGFFERLIVAYGGYTETVSWAYYYDLLTLKEMGENESVQQLLEEYRTRIAILKKTEAYPLINETFTL